MARVHHVQSGWGNRVLFRVIEQLRSAMPRVIGNLIATNFWSYKVQHLFLWAHVKCLPLLLLTHVLLLLLGRQYFDNRKGINPHADNAIVNANFCKDSHAIGVGCHHHQPPELTIVGCMTAYVWVGGRGDT